LRGKDLNLRPLGYEFDPNIFVLFAFVSLCIVTHCRKRQLDSNFRIKAFDLVCSDLVGLVSTC